MASLCRQIIRGNAVRSVLFSSARRGYGDKMMPDPLEHATGMERKELMALQAGNDDPFNMKVLKKSAGTLESPTLVPSCFDARIVGCILMPDPLEHATGMERKELMAIQAGNPDPFNLVLKKSAGTRESPTLVPSCFDARIVGCVCEEHATSVTWLWVHKDRPRRCECGHWYKLVEKELI